MTYKMTSLEQGIVYFMNHQEEFAREHHGEFVVIFRDEVEGFYKHPGEAYETAKRKFPPGSFLLRQCLRRGEEPQRVFHSERAG